MYYRIVHLYPNSGSRFFSKAEEDGLGTKFLVLGLPSLLFCPLGLKFI